MEITGIRKSEGDMFKESFRGGVFHPVRLHNKVLTDSKIYYRSEVVK